MERQRYTLDNGITLLSIENPAVDLVSGRFFFRYGTQVESPQQAGLVHLVTALITKGTQSRNAQEIAELIESRGASLSTEASADYLVLNSKTLTSDFADILALTSEILRSPSFPASELELEKHLTLQGIKAKQERPFSLAYDQLQTLLFGNHPYGLPLVGFSETVSQLTQADLQNYHRQYVRPAHLVISLAGNLSPDRAFKLVSQYFGDWQNPNVDFPPPPPPPPQPPTTFHIPKSTQQSIVMLGYPALAVTDPNYSAMKLIATYLGSGLSSRLFVELREKQGLAYEVSAFYPTRQFTSQLVAYMGTAPQNIDRARTGLEQECQRLAETALAPEELDLAKSKLLGQYALSKQTNSQLAQTYGWYESLGIGADFDQRFREQVEQVTPDQLQAVAQQCFGAPSVVIVGDIPNIQV